MTLRRPIIGAGAFGICALLAAGTTQAQVSNGGFETGNFTSWATSGYTAVEQFTTNPTTDGHYASFQIAPTSGSSLALAGTDHFGGGTPDPTSASGLETFLGLSSGALDAIANPDSTIEGSAFQQTFHANAGDVLSFAWDFATSETSAPINNDFGFYTLNGTAFKLADTNSSLSSISGGASAPYDQHTGFAVKTVTLTTTGNYSLGFGAVNVNDNAISSALLVDDVHLSGGGGTPNVPEPGLIALLVGAGVSGLLLKRRTKRCH